MTRHSSLSISPLWSVSRKCRAFLRRGGWSRNIRLSSPQLLINLTTSASFFMAVTISSIDSVPPPSLSMSSKQRWAAERNSPVNSCVVCV